MKIYLLDHRWRSVGEKMNERDNNTILDRDCDFECREQFWSFWIGWTRI